MAIIYHITTQENWEEAQKAGYYEHPALKDEGFIHCSMDHQVEAVLERYFAGQTDLVKLVIETEKLKSKYVFDWSASSADTFPHVYGPINTDAVLEAISL